MAIIRHEYEESMTRVIHYDATGRRVSRFDSFDGATTTNTFGYNIRSEVISALMGTNTYGYAYDPIGNRLTSSHNADTNLYFANCLDQYTTISNLCLSAPPRDETNPVNPVNPVNTNPCAYDADGNMSNRKKGVFHESVFHPSWVNAAHRIQSGGAAEVR